MKGKQLKHAVFPFLEKTARDDEEKGEGHRRTETPRYFEGEEEGYPPFPHKKRCAGRPDGGEKKS